MESAPVDLYLFLPCKRDSGAHCPDAGYCSESPLLAELNNTAKFEFALEMSDYLERYCLGDILLCCYSDQGELIGEAPAQMLITCLKNSRLSVVHLAVLDLYMEASILLDQAVRGELRIRFEGKEQPVLKFLECTHALSDFGKAKALACATDMSKEELSFILAGECNQFKEAYQISSREISRAANLNISQYSFYDAYASPTSVVYLMEKNLAASGEKIKIECLAIFIIELIALRISAINDINKNVMEQISGENRSFEIVVKILDDFSKISFLWNKHNFIYQAAQIFSNNINDAFKVPELLEEYKDNMDLLEHVVSINNSIAVNKESFVLSVIAILLTLAQVTPLAYTIVEAYESGVSFSFMAALASFILTVFTILFIVCFISHKTRRRISSLKRRVVLRTTLKVRRPRIRW